MNKRAAAIIFFLSIIYGNIPVQGKAYKEGYDENTICYKATALLNGGDIKSLTGSKIMHASTTLQHGIYWNYTRVTSKNLLFSLGAGFSQEPIKWRCMIISERTMLPLQAWTCQQT